MPITAVTAPNSMWPTPHSTTSVHRDDFDMSLHDDPLRYAAVTGRDRLEECFSSFSDALPSTPDGSIAPELLVQRPCPRCGSMAASVLFKKYRFPIKQCFHCSFIYASPLLREDASTADLEEGTMSQQHLSMLTQDLYLSCAKKRFLFEMQQAFTHATIPLVNYLEIGCSVGTGLEVAARTGMRVTGIEPNRDAAQCATAAGFRVIQNRFSPEIVRGEKFDLVASMDVLEHCPDPVALCASTFQVLKHQGLMLVQVPNAGSLITLLRGADDQIFNGLIHYNYFDAASLDALARHTGFEPVATITALSELGKINRYPLSAIHAVLSSRSGTRPHHFPLHQDWIHDNLLGYKVIGIYRKPS